MSDFTDNDKAILYVCHLIDLGVKEGFLETNDPFPLISEEKTKVAEALVASNFELEGEKIQAILTALYAETFNVAPEDEDLVLFMVIMLARVGVEGLREFLDSYTPPELEAEPA